MRRWASLSGRTRCTDSVSAMKLSPTLAAPPMARTVSLMAFAVRTWVSSPIICCSTTSIMGALDAASCTAAASSRSRTPRPGAFDLELCMDPAYTRFPGNSAV